MLNELHADGKRTGNYILAGEEFTFNDKGEVLLAMRIMLLALLMRLKIPNTFRNVLVTWKIITKKPTLLRRLVFYDLSFF